MTIEVDRTKFFESVAEMIANKKRIGEINTLLRSTENMHPTFVRDYESEIEQIAARCPALLEILNTLADQLVTHFIGKRTRALIKSAASEVIYAALGGQEADKVALATVNKAPN